MSWVTVLQHLLDLSLFALYCAALAFLIRWAAPRLLPAAKLLAFLFLGAHVLALVMGEILQPSTAFARWFWDLDNEWNFPSTVAAAQLMLIGFIAFGIGWRSVKRQVWERLYILCVAAGFLYLGYDEYILLHENNVHWELHYSAAGAVLGITGLLVFRRSSRQDRQFAACIPIGLVVAAGGATAFEIYSLECRAWGYISIAGECLKLFHVEEVLESLGVWLGLIGALGLFSGLSPRPNLFFQRLLYALPLFVALFLSQSGAIEPISLQTAGKDAAVLESRGVQLQGVKIEKNKHHIRVNLYLSPSGWNFNGLGYSITLLDQVSHAVVANGDAYAGKDLNFLLAPGYIPVFRQWIELSIPEDAPSNRAIWIVLSLWREENGDYVRQKILSSDHHLLNDTQVVLGEFVIKSKSERSAAAPLASFASGFKLEAAELPVSAYAGSLMEATFSWRADESGSEDLAQFLHFVAVEGDAFWNHDQQPLGARLPTRLWYRSLSDSEIWTVSLPEDLPAGDYQLFTGLYRLEDHARVIARDASGNPFSDSVVPLGSLLILDPVS